MMIEARFHSCRCALKLLEVNGEFPSLRASAQVLNRAQFSCYPAEKIRKAFSNSSRRVNKVVILFNHSDTCEIPRAFRPINWISQRHAGRRSKDACSESGYVRRRTLKLREITSSGGGMYVAIRGQRCFVSGCAVATAMPYRAGHRLRSHVKIGR